MNPTLLASAARILWRLLERYGVDPIYVFREVGLDPEQIHDSRARYADVKTRAAWQLASELIDDPCFGLLAGDVWRPTDFHALGYAFLASRTLQTAIERIVRFNTVVDSVVHFEAELDAHHLRLTYRIADPRITEPDALQDGRLAVVCGLCRQAEGEGFSPEAVSVTHPAPACRGDYFARFRCPVHFDADQPELVLTRAQAEAPLPAASRELALANDSILSDYVRTLQHDDVVSKVKTAIIEHLPTGTPSAELIAKDLYISARTLHRRLAEAQTSFSETLETVRRELARQYVSDPSLSLSEISFLLGFSEQSAFSRAFRRWYDQPPSAYRDTAA
jgi:AraC-like DNA-binding protein